MNRQLFLIAILSTIVIILQLIRTIIMSDMWILGDDYIQTVSDNNEYRAKNLLLKESLLQEASYTVINDRAQEEGYQKATILRFPEDPKFRN